MSNDQGAQDPLDFVRSMWSNMGFSLPGMVTPTLDVGELDKRIADMRAVETWLKMNLNMLQMTIQSLDMQRAAIAAVQAMSEQTQQKSGTTGENASNPFASAAAMWPWNLMNPQAASAPATPEPQTGSTTKAPRGARSTKKEQ